jgi:hypothetical protein
MAMTWKQLSKLGRALPEVVEGIWSRLSALGAAECRLQLERGWRLKAPKALVRQRDEAAPPKAKR